MADRLRIFLVESNLIEDIRRGPTADETEAAVTFLRLPAVKLADMTKLALAFGGRLRNQHGMNVYGSGYEHLAPLGGPAIERRLTALLRDATRKTVSPHILHRRYEDLHPFTRGNGRTGRILWAWQTAHEGHDPFTKPFLLRWYFDSLASR